jgi:hypothetical protein
VVLWKSLLNDNFRALRSTWFRARFALVAVAGFCLAGCGGPAVLYLSDPVWEGAFAKESRDIGRGIADAGYKARKVTLAMDDPRTELFSAVLSAKERIIVLSPLLALDAEALASSFPQKLIALPGGRARPASASILSAASDAKASIEAMGVAAARFMAKGAREGAKGDKVDLGLGESPAPGAGGASPGLAAGVFSPTEDGVAMAQAFRSGFESVAQETGLGSGDLVIEMAGEDRAEAESRAAALFGSDIRFLFLDAGKASAYFINTAPTRGCLIAGRGIRRLGPLNPSVVASLEDDYRALAKASLALAKASLTLAKSGPASPPALIPLELLPLDRNLSASLGYRGPGRSGPASKAETPEKP